VIIFVKQVQAVDALTVVIEDVLTMGVFVDRSASPVNEQSVADGDVMPLT
jgi:hypothetical protein